MKTLGFIKMIVSLINTTKFTVNDYQKEVTFDLIQKRTKGDSSCD